MTTRRQRLERLKIRADRFERVVQTALRRAIRAGTNQLGEVLTAAVAEPAEPYVSLDDLAAIESAWQTELRELILPELGRTMAEGAQDAIDDLVARVPVLIDSRHPAAELHIAQAENRLRGIGTDLWQNTRAQLVAGMADGESIPELSRRVRQEIASTTVRATTVARTEVISASNAGGLAQMRAMGDEGPTRKEWLATADRRTRLSHRIANGQTAELGSKFEVGGSQLDFPGDPTGPAGEVINCRCTMVWGFDEAPRLVATGGFAAPSQADYAFFDAAPMTMQEQHTSGMIALVPVEPLTIEGGEPAEESHLTLWFLGSVSEIPAELQRSILAEVESRASANWSGPIEGNAFGIAAWNPLGEEPCIVLNVGGDQLRPMRDDMQQALVNAPDNAGSNQEAAKAWQLPEQHQPWAPHVCLAYLDEPFERMDEGLDLLGPISFDRVRVALGDEVHDFPLGGG